MLAALFVALGTATVTSATCYLDGNGKAEIKLNTADPNGVAWAVFNDTINELGYNHIVIKTNGSYPSKEQMKCAGYIDGKLMQHRIYERFLLYKDIMKIPREQPISDVWSTWLLDNLQYMRDQISSNPNDTYWHDISLILDQFDGLVDGYLDSVPESERLSVSDLLVIQSVGDIYDLKAVWEPTEPRNPLWGLECSALVRLLPDYSDIYFGHDSWSDYRKMTNLIKEYHFDVPERVAKKVVVSTKMGALPSSEDFWLTDRGLMIFETTNSNFNESLFDLIKKETVLTWVRNLHAAWVADSSEEWADEFLKYNSGTYNNQYVIVDSKKFVPGERPTKDLIWITETMPGIAVKRDVTNVFVDQGYWPSFNVPYTEEIFNIAGYHENDYYNSSRYLIFHRDAPLVTNFKEFKELLRKNDYENEEYDQDPGQQIMARYDLRKENPVAFGALDTKVTTAMESLGFLKFQAIGSPEYEKHGPWKFDQPPFEDIKHDGLPTVWQFDWINYTTSGYDRCGVATTKEECFDVPYCGWCTYTKECVLGHQKGPALGYYCGSGWFYKPLPSWAIPVIASVTSVSVAVIVAVVGYNIYSWRKDTDPNGYEKM